MHLRPISPKKHSNIFCFTFCANQEMNAFVYNVQIKREKWLTPQIVYLTPQIHAWAVMLTPQLPSVISSAGHHGASPGIHFLFVQQWFGRIRLGLQPTFSVPVLVNSSMFVSTFCSVLVFVLIFPILDRWLADVRMEEVALVHGVVCPADRFCTAAHHCWQNSQPCSHQGGTMPWGEVAAYRYRPASYHSSHQSCCTLC